jgi:hypothetical protein
MGFVVGLRRGGVFDGNEVVRIWVGRDLQVVDRGDAPGMASLPRFIIGRDAIPFHKSGSRFSTTTSNTWSGPVMTSSSSTS